MTAAGVRALAPSQSRTKAGLNPNSTVADAGAPASPTTVPQRRPNVTNAEIGNSTSDRATITFIRRVLCSQNCDKSTPLSALLPPLSSRNDVDVQIYALLAIIMKEFVYSWYSRMTPDQKFVEEIVNIVAHITRSLEQRIRKVDLESLLLDEIPELLEAHVHAYHISNSPLHPAPCQESPRQVYHSLSPSPALSPTPNEHSPETALQQQTNETAYRDLIVHGLLAILLPTEDFQNEALTSIVDQILSEMIVGSGLGGKASQPWVIYDGILTITKVIEKSKSNSKKSQIGQKPTTGISTETENVAPQPVSRFERYWESSQRVFLLVLHCFSMALSGLRAFAMVVMTSSTFPMRENSFVRKTRTSSTSAQPDNEFTPVSQKSFKNSSSEAASPVFKQPIIDMKLWPCIGSLLQLRIRMPWLHSTFSLLQWAALRGPGGSGCTNGLLDKLLHSHITLRLVDPENIAPTLRLIRAAIFPNNAPGPPKVAPSPEETLQLRRSAAEGLYALIPAPVARVYFGVRHAHDEVADRTRRVDQIEDQILGVFGDEYMNKHLMYGLLNLLVVRLLPEMAEMTVSELRAERLGPFDDT